MVTKKKLTAAVVIAVLVTTLIVGAFSFSIANALNRLDSDRSSGTVATVSSVIQKLFYRPVEEEALNEAAIDGMIASLDDPYAEYYNADDWQQFLLDQQGEYTGIGVQVVYDEENDGITVIHVFKDSPAEKAGVLEGDFIFSADGDTFEDEDYQAIIDRIRGESGTSVLIGIRRGEEELSFDIIRQDVIAEQAYYKMLDQNIGYLELYSFTGNALDMFKDAKDFFVENHAQALVIDLRNNLGGDLGQVTKMLDILLPKGTLIITRDRDGVESTIESDSGMWDIPIAVLVNEYSASASELFSIAIQDYERGPVIGEVTYGKGVVQSVLPLDNGNTGIKITTSEYFSPNGRSINQIGVTPDYSVADKEFMDEDDPILEKALELLAG